MGLETWVSMVLAVTAGAGAGPPAAAGSAELPAPGPAIRLLAVGGGADPASNQVSLEQDIGLARERFGPAAVTLFGGGDGRSPVQVLDPKHDPTTLRARLGVLFDPRPGRASRYRPTRLTDAGVATAESLQASFERALARGEDPLVLYIAAHGDRGQSPDGNVAVLWGGSTVTPIDLARWHDSHPRDRPLRVIFTGCFSGGFAEIVWADANPKAGLTTRERCGFFAAPWNRESTGCDPDPERRVKDGYGLHLLRALAGQTAAAEAIPLAHIDIDGDGQISLLEAHTRARVAASSIDIPQTTSERYLREVAPKDGPKGTGSLGMPEEREVVRALGAALELPTAEAVRAAMATAERALSDLDTELGEAELEALADADALIVRLLERWPVLDDPWHPGFAQTLAGNAAAISKLLDDSPAADAGKGERTRVERLTERWMQADIRYARIARLAQAHDTLELAGRLQRRGGQAFAQYRRLLSCERWVP